MADSNRTDVLADALHAMVAVSPVAGEVEDELFRLARIYESSDALRTTLSDATVPMARRHQVVEELLSGRATPTTVAILGLLVSLDRASDLPKLVDAMARRSAAASNRSLAEVRSAVPLDDAQVDRLAAALEKQVGHPVKIRVIVDPAVVGGVVTQIGDLVIDGSVRSRLAQLREAF
ncbi:MAG: ATP synthase F1 subunit delta [Planctomycetes bacterium]|nr:ATP synthase F1 subunit delta [Actinomycetota bacterium]MBM4022891.1 ATP synthase F1 subunit delta [Planctomycetota bacterium]